MSSNFYQKFSAKFDAFSGKFRGLIVKAHLLMLGAKVGKYLLVGKDFRLVRKSLSGLTIGDDVYLGPRVTIDISSAGIIEIKSGVRITGDCFISSEKSVIINEGVIIGEFCSMRDSGHIFSDLKIPIKDQGMSLKEIKIGRWSWICRGCVVIGGADIQQSSVIGANSLVNSRLETIGVYVGVPVSKIKTIKNDN